MNENPPIHIRFNPKRIDINDVVTGLKNDKIETESLNTINYFLIHLFLNELLVENKYQILGLIL